MATKLVTNEFVAMGDLHSIAFNLTVKDAILSSYLVSFAISSEVEIVSGLIKSISQKQGGYVVKFSLRLLLGATLAVVITGTIVGFYF